MLHCQREAQEKEESCGILMYILELFWTEFLLAAISLNSHRIQFFICWKN